MTSFMGVGTAGGPPRADYRAVQGLQLQRTARHNVGVHRGLQVGQIVLDVGQRRIVYIKAGS